MAGVIAAVFTFAGIGIIAGGAFAVFLYRRRVPFASLTPGMGAKLGAATGLIGFAILAAIMGITVMFTGPAKFHAEFLQAFQQYTQRSATDPQIQQQALELLKTPEGFTLALMIGMGGLLIVFAALASVGGAVTAALVRRRRP
jgi:hypothetical protein